MADLNNFNVVSWHGLNSPDHKAAVEKWAAKDFRTLSLSVYDDPSDPLYAAVMVKRASVHPETRVRHRSETQIKSDIDQQKANNFGPFIITATGPRASATFAACFRAMDTMPDTHVDMSHAEFDAQDAKHHAAGEILAWFDVYGSDDDPRFAAIWVKAPAHVAWSVFGYDIATQRQQSLEDSTMLQQRFEAIRSTWGRPAHLAMAPAGKAVELFVDSTLGSWLSRAYMTSDDLTKETEKQKGLGLEPVQVSARGSGSDARFAAIYASRENTDSRSFRSHGPVTVAAIDQAMEQFVKVNNLRGSSLAIANGSQLVYAKGYTWAESGYPDITPQTPFRQASVSKTFTAVAMARILQDSSNVTQDTPIQSILNLKQPDGSPPKDSHRWNEIKIRHLFRSDSGLNQGLIYSSAAAAAAFKGKFPVTFEQYLSYATTVDTTGEPGDPNNSVYGNFDYILLGQIVARLSGADSYEAALKKLVIDPLHLKHTHRSRSLMEDQPAGDARHHMAVYDPTGSWPRFPFEVVESVRDNTHRLLPTHYGGLDYEIFSGAGGMSASAVDMARLCAMFSVRNNNPVLTPNRIDSLFNGAIAAASQKGPDGQGSHGYYGFDWASADDPANNVFSAYKGGSLPGQGTVIQFTTGGFAYALTLNGSQISQFDWRTPIFDATENHDWGPHDLFVTEYGMPSLGETKKGHKTSHPHPAVDERQVEKSMARAYASRPRRRLMSV